MDADEIAALSSRQEVPPAVTSAEFASMVARKKDTAGLSVTRGLQTEMGAGEGRTFDVRGTGSAVDFDNEVVHVSGTDLAFYKTNPVGYAFHQSKELPVFLTKAIEIKDEEILFRIKYAPKEINPLADSLYQSHVWRLEEKALDDAGGMYSQRFRPARWAKGEQPSFTFNKSRGGLDFHRQTLMELSDVGIGAYPTAHILQAKAAGVPMDPIMEWAQRVLETDPGVVVLKGVGAERIVKALDPPKAIVAVEIPATTKDEPGDSEPASTGLEARIEALEKQLAAAKPAEEPEGKPAKTYTHEEVAGRVKQLLDEKLRLAGACL